MGDGTDASSVGAVNGSDAMSDAYGGVGPGGFGGDGFGLGSLDFGDIADVGTLGGNMADAFGENSVTMGLGMPDQSQDPNDSIYGKIPQVVINGVKGAALSHAAGQAAPVLGALFSAANAPEGKKGGAFMGALSPMLLGPLAPIHSLVTSLLGIPSMGQSIANHNGYTGADGSANSFSGEANTGGNSSNWGNALGGLGQLYSMYTRNRDSDRFTSTLANMYGPNSPYAKQLAQSLARRDAAAGRRTQYGPREVELQAQLAKMQAGVAPNVMQGQQQGLNNMLKMMQMAGFMQKSGAFSGIGDMFTPQWNNYSQVSQSWNPSTPIDPNISWEG